MENTEQISRSELKQKLVTDVKEVLADAEGLIRATAGDIGEKAKVAREKLSGRISKTKEMLLDWEENVREKAIAGAKETDRIIRDHPYETVGVAFAVGLLVGFLINRK